MKRIVLTSLIFVAITGSVVSAQQFRRSSGVAMPLRLSVRPDSRLWLEGSSNIRDWRCDATTLDASIDLDDGAAYDASDKAIERLRRVQVRVPTYALTCGRSQMDNIMYKALRVDDAPDCRQIVGHFEVVSRSDDADHSLVMQGTLRIAGRERVVRVPVEVQQQRDGSLRAQGALPILMTDYGITPPKALFGVLRTENRIVVKFDLLVDRASTIASADGER
ncbi:MAG TPA: YceI family protein [Gemmatimonadaceae bacterium]|jgi:polyisoprenoid-binding protein YceI|nr:YceI family protein [Gemmatimonadaceae bacterium]